MTVEENIRFPLDMFTSKSDEEKRHRVQECLKSKLNRSGKKYPGEISGGMMKRVGIARAIVMEPKYLSVMNPTPGLILKLPWLLMS